MSVWILVFDCRPNAKEPCGAALLDIRNQAIIIEYLLKNVAIFFDKNLASAAIAFYPETDNSEVNVPENGKMHVMLINTLKELILLILVAQLF